MTFEPLYALPLAVACVGAIVDIRRRTLPNTVCLALALASAASIWTAGGLTDLAWSLSHAVLALLTGMALFRFGLIGGGDAKFYAAAACGIPLQSSLALLGWTSLAGMALLAVLTLSRLASGKKLVEMRGYSVPYGVAIFLGFALTLTLSSGNFPRTDGL